MPVKTEIDRKSEARRWEDSPRIKVTQGVGSVNGKHKRAKRQTQRNGERSMKKITGRRDRNQQYRGGVPEAGLTIK